MWVDVLYHYAFLSLVVFPCQVNLLVAANKKSSELSGGMRRRLSVAMACIGNPDILILGQCID